MINPDLFNQETESRLLNAVLVFNEHYEQRPSEITGYTYFELYQMTDPKHKITLGDWKEFIRDRRVQQWYSDELQLTINARLQSLAKKAGTDKSTATQQTLTSLLKYTEAGREVEESNEIYIYGHIPLTPNEEKLENVKYIKTIPKEIADALTVYERSDNKKE